MKRGNQLFAEAARPQLYLTDSERAALRTLRDGCANEHQQKLAWKTIIEIVANVRGSSFFPGGIDGQRATDFNEGRRWVGRSLEEAAKFEAPVDPRGEPPEVPAK